MSRTRTQGVLTGVLASGEFTVSNDTINPVRYFPPWGVYYPDAGSYVTTAIPASHLYSLTGKTGTVESMTDTKTSPGSFNYCLHTKETWNCPISVYTAVGSCSPNDGTTRVDSSFNAGAATAITNRYSPPFTATDETLLSEAEGQLQPRVVKPAWDMAQQIGEYLETAHALKNVFKTVKRIQRELAKQDRYNSPIVRRILGQKTVEDLSLRNWFDLAVQTNLANQFALQPMLQSISDLHKALDGWHNELMKYVSGTETLHGMSSRSATASSHTPNTLHRTLGNQRHVEVVVHATATVKYTSPLTQRLIEKFDTAYFGRLPNIDTAWELTPLSFIADMFVNVGGALEQLVAKPIDDITYEVLESGWSKLITYTIDGYVMIETGTVADDYCNLDPPSMVTGLWEKTTFLREPKTLNLESVVVAAPELRLPGISQALSIAQVAYAIKTGFRDIIRVV